MQDYTTRLYDLFHELSLGDDELAAVMGRAFKELEGRFLAFEMAEIKRGTPAKVLAFGLASAANLLAFGFALVSTKKGREENVSKALLLNANAVLDALVAATEGLRDDRQAEGEEGNGKLEPD